MPASTHPLAGQPFFEMPQLTAGGDWQARTAGTIPKACAVVRGHSVDVLKGIYEASGDELRANVTAAAAVGDLLRLAIKVANLNRAAGEIGDGMLCQLVDEARAAARRAGAKETPAS